MQNVVQFRISNLITSLNNMPNFFNQFGQFCNYYPCCSCWCCNSFFQAIGISLVPMQKPPQPAFADDAEFFCMDVASVGYKSNGERDYVNSPLAIVKNKSGIFIYFHRHTQKTLFIGNSGRFYFSNGGPGRVAQLINGNDTTISDYLQKNIPNVTINDCSIFFLCLDSASNLAGDFDQALEDLKNVLESILKPAI